MAGQYIIPLLGNERIRCIVAIALSNTNMVPLNAENIKTPVLIVWGDKDTSLGPTCASNLKRLPNSKYFFKYFSNILFEFLSILIFYDNM